LKTTQQVILGDCKEDLPELHKRKIEFDCIITSPQYWGMRKYDHAEVDFIGMEREPIDYIQKLVGIYCWCHAILKDKGLFFLNAGNGKRVNREIIVPAWYHWWLCRSVGFKLTMTLVWYDPARTPNNSPRILKNNYEPIFVFFKDKDYNFYKDEIRVPYSRFHPDPATGKDPNAWGCDKDMPWTLNPRGADPGDVWKIHHPRGCHGRVGIDRKLHIAPFPEELIEQILLCSTKEGDFVLDPFCGIGTVGVVCKRLNRNFIGIDIIEEYAEIAQKRIDEI